MKQFVQISGIAIAALLFVSCEKEVDFNLPSSVSEKVVVEGGIEVNVPPIVMLTKSFGFTSSINLGTLQDAFISGAAISVSDGSKTVHLKEYSIDTLNNKYNFYSVDTANPIDFSFVGQSGKTYALKIELNGKIYESTTTIPNAVPFDSIWSVPFDDPDPEHPEFRKVMVKYTDPIEMGNRYRVFIKQNSRPFIARRFSTFEDAIINGTTTEMDYYNVLSPMDTSTNMASYAFLPGDTVTIKFSAIDKTTYDFWQTLDFSVGTTGNPFATPVKVPTNISNGALGIWGGYAPTYKTVVITD